MNKAKNYYINSRNMMVHRTSQYNAVRKELIEKPAIPFHAKLKVTGLGRLNSGILFYLEDENGTTYVMNDAMMCEYIDNTDIGIFVEGDWDFYQQGASYSIGLASKKEEY